MVEVNGLKFSTTIGTLFMLKDMKQHKTLAETYNLLGSADLDTMLDVLRASYNQCNKTSICEAEFAELLDQKDIGFIKLTSIVTEVIEKLMYNGLSPKEIESKKKMLEKKQIQS